MRNRPTRYADVVCFGMIIPAIVLAVDQFPAHNTGALIRQTAEIISDDAAIVACLLRGWKVCSGLIGSALGNDARGKATARKLKRLGVMGRVRLMKSIATPYEVDVSDGSGARTYFWQRDARVLDTLNTANLSLLRGARMLYVDWYDGDHILRALSRAARLKTPVFLNLEYGHQDAHAFESFVPRAQIVQAVTDAAQNEGNALSVAKKLLDAGAQTALVTLAGEGCIAATRAETIRAQAPRVSVVDGCGAGAAFSAGFIYGHLRGWTLDEKIRFAIAAGSFKCTRVGLDALPLKEVQTLAHDVGVKHLRQARRTE